MLKLCRNLAGLPPGKRMCRATAFPRSPVPGVTGQKNRTDPGGRGAVLGDGKNILLPEYPRRRLPAGLERNNSPPMARTPCTGHLHNPSRPSVRSPGPCRGWGQYPFRARISAQKEPVFRRRAAAGNTKPTKGMTKRAARLVIPLTGRHIGGNGCFARQRKNEPSAPLEDVRAVGEGGARINDSN